VRTSATEATALSATCTHAGCLVLFESGSSVVRCPCHDARFALDGSVQGGPTVIPLPVYSATVDADGIAVDLS
jgi:cytochrome b6-f complex iron-sulfur subunit